jgi:hypothetical protein
VLKFVFLKDDSKNRVRLLIVFFKGLLFSNRFHLTLIGFCERERRKQWRRIHFRDCQTLSDHFLTDYFTVFKIDNFGERF